MRGHSLIGAVLLFCAAPAAGWAQQQVPLQQRVVASGRSTPVYPYIVVNPACKTIGQADIGLTESPRHGRVKVEPGIDYPSFSAANPLSVCNKQKFPSQRIVYTSEPGFTGEDEFVVEAIGPFGVPQRGRFHITVR